MHAVDAILVLFDSFERWARASTINKIKMEPPSAYSISVDS